MSINCIINNMIDDKELRFEMCLEYTWGGGKIVSRGELESLVRILRSLGKTIVTTNGSFDLLHPGHINVLKEASQQGDVLIVGLNSDSSVASYKKDRPIIPENYRSDMLSAIKFVDFIHIFPEENPIAFLEKIKPDVHVNSSEYGVNCIEAPTVKQGGGSLYIVPRMDTISSTDIIKKITNLKPEKAVYYDKSDT